MDVREKLVEILGNIYLPIMAGPDVIGEYRIPHKLKEEIADHLIANGVTVQEWVSVDDRLPDKPMKCLVYTKRGDCGGYEITYYNQGFYLQYSNVTHWMPLPEPPKGE